MQLFLGALRQYLEGSITGPVGRNVGSRQPLAVYVMPEIILRADARIQICRVKAMACRGICRRWWWRVGLASLGLTVTLCLAALPNINPPSVVHVVTVSAGE